MTFFIIILLLLLVPGIGGIILQIFLSKKAGKWPGLILPLLTLCISLIAVFSIASSTIAAYTRLQLQDNQGNVVREFPRGAGSAKIIQEIPDIPSLFFTALQVFLLFNLPTIFYWQFTSPAGGDCAEKRPLKKCSYWIWNNRGLISYPFTFSF